VIPKLVIFAAEMALSMAMNASRRVTGPRLESLKTTTADFGTPINRFWGKRRFECPIIWAADLIETRHTSKGKSGKATEYKYYADFALLIADHEIDGVTRIWMDDKLVYQTTAAGPSSIGAAAGLRVGGNMRVYLGTEGQTADPLMQAWCEDRYGANSCPAYRGSAYIVFQRLPVNNFGNRIPNISVEAVSSKAPFYPYEIKDAPNYGVGLLAFSRDFTTFITSEHTSGNDSFDVWDTASRTKLYTSIWPVNLVGNFVFTDAGTIYLLDDVFSASTVSGDGLSLLSSTPLNYAGASIYYAGGLGCITALTAHTIAQLYDGASVTEVDVGFKVLTYFTGSDDLPWALGRSGTDIKIYTSLTGASSSLTVPDVAGGTNIPYGLRNSAGNIVLVRGTSATLIDTSGTILDTATLAGTLTAETFANHDGSDFLFAGANKYSLLDLSLVQSGDFTDWDSTVGGSVYDPINNALFGHQPGVVGKVNWLYLDRVSPAPVTLKTIVDTVSGWCGLTGQDTTALTQEVIGYSVTQGTGKDMISPLLDIYDVDPRPHDFGVQFVTRGAGPTGAILLTEDFVRGDSRYKVTVQQDTDLPRKLTFNFADSNHDQQPNNVISQRPLDAIDTMREETIDLSTFVDTPDGAQQKADRFFRRVWNSRERTSNALTAQELALEPADVRTLSLDGRLVNARLDKLTITPTSLECEWVRDEVSVAAVNSATTGPEIEGSDPDTIVIPGPSRGFFVDAPLVRDADNDINPLIYLGAGGYGSFSGADVYRDDSPVLVVDATMGATWGFASGALANADANLWDRGNTVDVSVFGTLDTVTEAEVNADPSLNLVALGADDRWEYLNFTTATLTGTSGNANTYTLSGFKRGRRGTEVNTGNHAVGDTLVLLSGLAPYELGMDTVGDSEAFKAQSFGRDPDAVPDTTLTFDGDTLKPYAPARIKWTTDGTDMFGEIIRRTRVGGSWVGGSTIPLSENSEAYEVDVYNGVTFKRTISVAGTNLFTYTGAQIAADGNTVGVPPTLNAYQISDAVGRGFALAA
jgi:hypothetical protein